MNRRRLTATTAMFAAGRLHIHLGGRPGQRIMVRDSDVYVVRITELKDRLAPADVDAIVQSIELTDGEG